MSAQSGTSLEGEIEKILSSEYGEPSFYATQQLLNLINKAVVEGRLIELDLLEQAINQGRNIQGYKMLRLEALSAGVGSQPTHPKGQSGSK